MKIVAIVPHAYDTIIIQLRYRIVSQLSPLGESTIFVDGLLMRYRRAREQEEAVWRKHLALVQHSFCKSPLGG